MKSQSEIAQLRAQIETECQAIQHQLLFSAMASHQLIEVRYRNLERYHGQLKSIIGEHQATDVVVDIYNHIIK